MDDKKKNPEDEASGNEVESPVDGPTPDWMRLATSAGSSGSSLTEENTPAWLKSIRAGQGLSKDTPDEPAKSKPVEEPAKADDSMSDLERLLAEEGIDLSAVAEERPEDAGGMSARDWLIATSSEEIIRNKLGAHPQAEEPAAPPPSPASISDDKMVVEEDLPDWLQEIADDAAETEPVLAASPIAAVEENDHLVVEEELPDWLQDIADETPAAGLADEVAASLPPGRVEPLISTEDKMVVEEGLPDWLQDIAADEVGDTTGKAEPALTDFEAGPPPPHPTSASFADDKMVVEEDLPDWLQDIAEEPATMDLPSLEQAGLLPTAEDEIVVEEDLPDWLQDIAEEPVTAEALSLGQADLIPTTEDKVVDEGGLPDWLQDIAEEPTIPAEAQPDWPEFATTAQPSLAEDKMVIEGDLPDWLREVSESEGLEEAALPPSVPSLASADKMIVEEDLPSWLREVEADGEETEVALPQTEPEMVAADLDETESDEGLPDWLREVEVSSLEESLAAPPPPSTFEEPPETTITPPISLTEEELDLDDEDLPAWLKEVQERDGRETTEAITRPATAEIDTATVSTEPVIEDELPDWLREVQEESAPPPEIETSEPVVAELADNRIVIEEDLPDWLREESRADEPFEPSEPSPEPLAEVMADELPDWLQEVQDEVPEEVLFEAETPTPVPTPSSLSADHLIDEEGLPDWLREAPEEEVAEEVEFPTIPEPVAVVSEEIMAAAVEVEQTTEEIGEEAEEAAPVSLPEPIPVSEPSIPSGGIPDWLQKLRQVEEEEPISVPVTPMPMPAFVPAAQPAPQPMVASTIAPPPEIPADAVEHLHQARSARDKGEIDEAVRIYGFLVSRGIYLDKVIEDMQQTIKAQPGNYLLFQLMGDAMMRDGRLQSALNAYREALSRLQ